jgi:hypothetical protein
MKMINLSLSLKKQVINMLLPAAFFFASCNTLDVPPPNIITDAEIFTSEEGIAAYLARLYNDMPLVQFYMGLLAGTNTPDVFAGQYIASPYEQTPHIGGGSLGDHSGEYIEDRKRPVWDYTSIRRQNYLLQVIGDYEGKPHTPARVAELKAHAYWIRAFRYFEMVKRYGGVPIVDKVLNYPEQTVEELKLPRNREKDCYDFILADCDRAIAGFSSDPSTRKAGYANKWDAYALKSRVALYAASIAKYGPRYTSGYLYPDGKGITGVITDSAGYYYKIAYDAGKEVVNSKLYELYKAKWVAGNADAIAENFASIFYDRASKEMMYSMQHAQLLFTPAFDANCLPNQVGTTYTPKPAPTVEFIEEFEYADASLLPAALKSKAGTPFRLNEALLGTDQAPKFYDSPVEVFEGIEPRLCGSVTLPGSVIRSEVIEIRYGIMPKGATQFNEATLLHTADLSLKYEGMNIQGASGMGDVVTTSTSFYNRKWFDPALPEEYIKDYTHGTEVPWQEFRYAEVLMNIAEAAMELKELNESYTPDMLDEAVQIIHDIRERAGAQADKYNSGNLTIQTVRAERSKEFYFENKSFWDYKRWRVFHEKVNDKRWNLLKPIFFWDQQKYYVKRDSTSQDYRWSFSQRYYYSDIPHRGENSLLIGNPTENY